MNNVKNEEIKQKVLYRPLFDETDYVALKSEMKNIQEKTVLLQMIFEFKTVKELAKDFDLAKMLHDDILTQLECDQKLLNEDADVVMENLNALHRAVNEKINDSKNNKYPFVLFSNLKVKKEVRQENGDAIYFPWTFSEELIAQLLNAYYTSYFVTLTRGNNKTGKASNEYDGVRGKVRFLGEKGELYPSLEVYGTNEDVLTNKSTKTISKKYTSRTIENQIVIGEEEILDCVALQFGGLDEDELSIAYKHPNFQKAKDFLELEVEEFKTLLSFNRSNYEIALKNRPAVSAYKINSNKEVYTNEKASDLILNMREVNLVDNKNFDKTKISTFNDIYFIPGEDGKLLFFKVQKNKKCFFETLIADYCILGFIQDDSGIKAAQWSLRTGKCQCVGYEDASMYDIDAVKR